MTKDLTPADSGLAAVLILVSFLYQRFITGKDEEEKQEA